MTISLTRAFGIALIPGAAEALEIQANNESNFAWFGIAKGMKYARNGLYVAVALTAIAAVGSVFAVAGAVLKYTCILAVALGGGLAILFGKKLYDAAREFQSARNSLPRD